MIYQPQSLSSLACNKIVQSLEYYLCKDQSLRLSTDLTNQVMNQAIRVLSFESSIPCEIWKFARCLEINVQSPISAKNIQILCALWRKTLTTLSICKGDFQYTEFLGDSFEKLRVLKIERSKNLCQKQLLNLCALLPENLEECTITYCDDLDNEVLKTLLKRCPHLQLLNIAGCKKVSAITSPVTNLRSLDVSSTQINDQVLFDINKEHLVYLNCSHTSISDVGLKSIETSCGKNLKSLDIQHCPSITYLGDGFTNLEMLGTYKTSIPIVSCSDIILRLPNTEGKQLLCVVVRNNDKHLADEIFKRILCNEMNHIIEIQDSDDNTFLHWACCTGYSNVALKLVEKMNPKALGLQGHFGRTALHLVIDRDLHDVAFRLIDAMSPDQLALQDENKDTVLHLACKWGLKDVALKLITKIDPKALGLQGVKEKTALHSALKKGLHDVAFQLIDAMSSDQLAVQDQNKDTVLYVACRQELKDLALKLITKMNPKALGLRSKSGETALHWAIWIGLHDVAFRLIDAMSPDQLALQDENKDTVLHVACKQELKDLALKLITKMDPEALGLQSQFGETALHLALRRGLYEVAKVLVDIMDKDSIQLVDFRNQTALSLAIELKQEELRLLIEMKLIAF